MSLLNHSSILGHHCSNNFLAPAASRFKTPGVWLVLTDGLWSRHRFQANLRNCPGMNCFHGGSQETFQEAPVFQRQPAGIEEEKEEFAHFLLGTLFTPGACRAFLLGKGCTAHGEPQRVAPPGAHAGQGSETPPSCRPRKQGRKRQQSPVSPCTPRNSPATAPGG